MNGLIGRKLGMTRIFREDGVSIPVTIIEAIPNHVTQIKNIERDGYNAIQVTVIYKKNSRLNKPQLGHLVNLGELRLFSRGLWEFKINDCNKLSVGDIITIKIFKYSKKVDITGISKGKGFAGTVKRWNFRMQDASHGNSLSHRAPGSIGQNQTPGRVFKGKKMAGHLGNDLITVQNLDVVDIDIDNNLLLIKGSIPGIIGENVVVKKSVKV